VGEALAPDPGGGRTVEVGKNPPQISH
jgi:hypothetical protein